MSPLYRLKNLTEFDCFVTALTAMLKTTPPGELFLPVSQEGIRMGKMEQNVFKNFNAACGKTILIDPLIPHVSS